jgi:hypothetical protein
MAETEVGLVWRLRAQGTRDVQAEIQRVTGGLTQARTTAGQAPNVTPWKSAIGGVHAEARNLLGTLGKVAAWGGLAAGAFGVSAVLKGFVSLSDEMRGIQTDTGKTDTQMAQLTERFRNLAGSIGKPAEEIAGLAHLINDLTGSFDRAAEAAPQLDLLAGAFGVKDVPAFGRAFAGLETISGGKIPVDKQMAMLREMLRATPMAEESTLEAAGRGAGRAASIGRLTGAEGIQSFGGILATLGKTYAQQPRKIQSGLDAILDTFELQLKDPEVRRSLTRLGVNMADAGTMFQGLLTALSTNPRALDAIKGLPSELGTIMLGAVANAGTYNDAMRGINGDVAALAATLAARKNDPSVKLGQATERMKQALEPLIVSLLPKLTAAVQKIAPWLERFAKFAADHGDALLSFLTFMAARALTAQIAGAFGGPAGAGGAAGAAGLIPMLAMGGGAAAGGAAGAAGGVQQLTPLGWRVNLGGGVNIPAPPSAMGGPAPAPTSLGPSTAPGMIGAAIGANTLFTAREVTDSLRRTRDAGRSQVRGQYASTAEARAAMAGMTDPGRTGFLGDLVRQLAQQVTQQIAINVAVQVSPDGTTGTARAATDARNGATVQVRDEYSGSYRPPPMQ